MNYDVNNLDFLIQLEAFDDLICNEKDPWKKETLQGIQKLLEELINEAVSR